MQITNLRELPIGVKANVKQIDNDESIKRRLLDIGLTRGTLVEKVYGNITRSLFAYNIRGALIAIRNEDAEKIIVEMT